MRTNLIVPGAIVFMAVAVAIFALFVAGVPESHPPQAVSPEAAVSTASSAKMKPIDQPLADTGRDRFGGSAESSVVPDVPAAPSAAITSTGQPLSSREAAMATIDDASVSYEPGGVGLIVPYLTSSDPEIRAAAVEGLKQLGEPKGAQELRRLSSTVTNPRDRAQFLEAAEFIELPAVELEWVQP